jgi:hypothetical protein
MSPLLKFFGPLVTGTPQNTNRTACVWPGVGSSQLYCTVCKSSRKYSAFCNTIQTGNFPLPGLVEHPPPPPPCCQLSIHSWQWSIFSWQPLVSNWLLAKNKTAADSFQIAAPCPSEIALVTQPAVSPQPAVSINQRLGQLPALSQLSVLNQLYAWVSWQS